MPHALEMPRPTTRIGSDLVIPAVIYTVAAVIASMPLALHLSTRLIGNPDLDVWNHVWGFWWFKTMLVDRHQVPLYADMLAYPNGGKLYFIDPLNGLLSIPLQWLFGLVPAYNLIQLGELALAGFATHLLAREAGVSSRTAWVAGMTVLASPILRCEIHNGITEVGNVGWLALSLLATHRALRIGRLRDAALAGLALALAFISCWYFGLSSGVAAGLMWLMLTPWRPLNYPRLIHHLACLAAFGLVAGAISIPVARVFSSTLWGGDALIMRPPKVSLFHIQHNATDLLGFFMPGDYHHPDLARQYGEAFLHTTYLGYAALVPAILGFRRRGSRAWMWATIGLIFGVLSLGPYLYAGGQFITWHGRMLRLPFHPIFSGFGMMAITHPGRLAIVTLLCLAVLAAMGVERLRERFPRLQGSFGPTILGCALLESIALGPAPWPLPTADAGFGESTRLMAADPLAGAVLDLPGQYQATMRTCRYLYDQTFHRRPVPYGVHVRTETTLGLRPEGLNRYIVDLAIKDEWYTNDGKAPQIEAIRAASPEALRQEFLRQFWYTKYRYIRLHRDLPTAPFGIGPYRMLFDPVLGPPIATADGCWLYRIDPNRLPTPRPSPAPP